MSNKKPLEPGNLKQINYFAIHITHVIVGILFLSLGMIFLIYYDYGVLTFLFEIPQFFLTGLIPALIAILILFRTIFEAEKVNISSNEKTLSIQTTWIRKKSIQQDYNSIKYIGLKYRETRVKRWIIIITLVLFTVEVFLVNALDLHGFARIAPILLIGTIIMFIGIVLFTFSPRRFIEIGNSEEAILIPCKNFSREKTEKLLQVLNVNTDIIERGKCSEKIYRNIISQFSNFIFGLFLIVFGIILSFIPSLFYGSFTRVISITLGMKLLLRVLNGDPYYVALKEDKNLFIGDSLRLTFIKTMNNEIEHQKSFSILRYHIFEIICFIYLISQAVKYTFRFAWWDYAGFSISYFLIGIALIGLIFIRWFNPISICNLKFKDFTLEVRESESIKIKNERKDPFKKILSKKLKDYISNFKTIRDDKNLQISLILFIVAIIWPIFYFIFGGNFIII